MYEKVLVPLDRSTTAEMVLSLDGSRLGEAALPAAEALAGGLNAELVLCHVLQPATTWGIYVGYPSYTASPPDAESRKAAANTYLDGLVKSLEEKGLRADCAVEWGLPARRIAEFAKDNSIDLMAMSTHGRSGIGEWVFGSVTNKVLQSGDTPVLVVRPPRA